MGKMIPELTDNDKARFFRHVINSNDGGCWGWKAETTDKGYARFNIKDDRFLASRISYKVHFFVDPSEMCVLHKCDNPACTNPEHLFLGTTQDNTADRNKKGRTARGRRHSSVTHPEKTPRGSRNGMSKLNEEMITEIRKMRQSGFKLTEIADAYNVSVATIGMIVLGKLWRHVA